MSIYTDLVEAGCQIDNHASDLYVKVTPASKKIVEAKGSKSVSKFICQRDGTPWFDIPFRFDPFWDEECNCKRCQS